MRIAFAAFRLLWLVVLLGGLAIVTRHTSQYAAAQSHLLDDPPLSRLDTRLIDILTLGHRGLYDDIANIWLLQLIVDPRLDAESPDDISRVIRNVTRHGPKLETLYMISCFTLGLDRERPELCEPLANDGIKALPDGWRIPAMQGFISYHQMKDAKKGALYYGLAASRPGAPAFLQKLTDNLVKNNEISPADLQESLDQLLNAPGGSRLGDFLKDRGNQNTNRRP